MTALDLFQYAGQQVRTVVIGGEPWFVASDVATILGYRMASDMTRNLDADEKGTQIVRTPSGDQSMSVISEPGLYGAILRSRIPAARDFKRWVKHDLLPTIRKAGRYGSDVDMLAHLPSSKLLMLAAEAAERAEKLQAQIEADAPKVHFANAVTASEESILIGQLAVILKQNGIDIGQNRLFERMRSEGYLCRAGANYNRPTQRAMDLGLFEVIERTRQNPDGSPRLMFTTKVTGKGQQYFINRYGMAVAS